MKEFLEQFARNVWMSLVIGLIIITGIGIVYSAVVLLGGWVILVLVWFFICAAVALIQTTDTSTGWWV